jgi:hypothetical protein
VKSNRNKETSPMPAKKSTKTKQPRAVLVTTEHRGVFFGYAIDVDGPTIALKNARNCLYWSASVKGFLRLAATGPDSSCRIGPRADITLRAITAVAEVTPAAVEAWEKAPWRS